MKIVISIMIFWLNIVFSQSNTVVNSNAQNYSTNKKSKRLIVVPLVGYLPESGFIAAAMGAFFLNPERESGKQPSVVTGLLALSTKKQITLNVLPDIYMAKDRLHLKGTFALLKWPAAFYGLGNESKKADREVYDSRGIVWDGGIEYRFNKFGGKLAAGFAQRIGYEKIITDIDKLLFTQKIAGYQGGWFSGWGGQLTLDHRDNVYWSTKGYYFQYVALLFHKKFGSEFEFAEHKIDQRIFIPFHKRYSVALGLLFKFQTGLPYFRYLATPDIRALEVGRYRDRQLVVIRWSNRFHIWKRLRGVIFTGFGGVANTIKKLSIRGFKYTIGGGIRFALNAQELVNLRLDLAWVDYGFNAEFILAEKF